MRYRTRRTPSPPCASCATTARSGPSSTAPDAPAENRCKYDAHLGHGGDMSSFNRRQVIKGAATAAAAGALGPFFPGRVLGANDRFVVAIVGTRGQGQSHIGGYGPMKDVKVKYLCDIDENVLATRQ